MLWSLFICLFVKIFTSVTHTHAAGILKIALETYRFEVSLTDDEGSSDPSDDSQVLADIDYVKDYSPLWKVKTSLEQDYENITDLKETAYTYWPWDSPTSCGSPVRFRFLVCLDYSQSYDPSRKCQLGRVQSELIDVSRDRFSATILGRKNINFGSFLRVLDDGDVITNPLMFDFEEWAGPIRLSVYVDCCGGSRYITDRCEDELTHALDIVPVPLVQGIQAMRYSVEGDRSNSLKFSVTANCEKDHYGKSCDVYCKIDKPALENAMCNSTTGERQCMQGWQGLDCQTDVDECRALMCKNGGTCQNVRGTYSCTCPFGTTGRRCQRRYPVCHLQPCQHQGTCLETPAGSLCFCMPGFDGQWCHLLEDEAETSRKVTDQQGSRSHKDNSNIVTITPVRTVMVRDNEKDHKSSSTWHDWYLAIIFGVFILIAVLLVLLFLLYRAKVRQQYKVTLPESTLLPVQALPKTRVFDNAVYEREDDSGIIQPNTFHIFYESKNIVDILNNTNNNNNNINNHSHNNNKITNDIGKSRNRVNNNTGVLLNASSLAHSKPGQTYGGNDKQQQPPLSMSPTKSPKVQNKSKSNDGPKRNGNAITNSELRPYSVETAERGGIDIKEKKNDPLSKSKTKTSSSQKHPTQDNFYSIPPPQHNDGPMVDRWKHIAGVYSSPKSPRSEKFGFAGPSYSSDYKEPKPNSGHTTSHDDTVMRNKVWHTGGSYVQYGAGSNSNTSQRDPQRKRKSDFMKSSEIEHDYEDIESDHGFMTHRPTPKPRSVYNVQCETLKRRYAVPEGIEHNAPEGENSGKGGREESNRNNIYNSNAFNQPYHYQRRSSDGLLCEQAREQPQLLQQSHHQPPPTPIAALKSRFDQPRFSEGDIIYPKPRPVHKHYSSQYDLKRKPLSLYVSPEDMTLMSNKSGTGGNGNGDGNNQNHGYANTNYTFLRVNHQIPKNNNPGSQHNSKNPYSEPRITTTPSPSTKDEQFFRGSDFSRSAGHLTLTKPKQSNTATSPRGGSSRFDFFSRPQSRHIYRNTDIEGFPVGNGKGKLSPKEPRSPTSSSIGWPTKAKSGESGLSLSSSFRRKSLVNLSSPPRGDFRRRKSEVMSEKLFRKKLTSELRSDSEASVDKCWWMQDDPGESILQNDDSAFV